MNTTQQDSQDLTGQNQPQQQLAGNQIEQFDGSNPPPAAQPAAVEQPHVQPEQLQPQAQPQLQAQPIVAPTAEPLPANQGQREQLIEESKTTIEKIKKRRILPNGSIEINLPSGKIANIMDFRGHHIQKARAMMDLTPGKEDTFAFALIALTTTIDGQVITMEDLQYNIRGFDVMLLQAEFESANF